MSALPLSIVIPSWNTRELLASCLESLARAELPEHEVVVVDNASRDNSVAMIQKEFPRVTLVENEVNVGFSAGNNEGVPLCEGAEAQEGLFDCFHPGTSPAPKVAARCVWETV